MSFEEDEEGEEEEDVKGESCFGDGFRFMKSGVRVWIGAGTGSGPADPLMGPLCGMGCMRMVGLTDTAVTAPPFCIEEEEDAMGFMPPNNARAIFSLSLGSLTSSTSFSFLPSF